MAKRDKRLRNAIESYKKEIEKHFEKLDEDILEKNEILAKYHIKEIDKSLINALEQKIKLLGDEKEYTDLVKKYKAWLEEYKDKAGISG